MNKNPIKIVFAVALAAMIPLSGCAATASTPIDLKTEALVEPVGLDTTAPRFSWRMETERPGAKQTAWQVQVATAADKLDASDLWDSGWVESDSNAWNAYAGKPLQAFQQFFWRVRLREENGKVTGWSQPARAEMGPLSSKDWKNAAWLKAPDYESDTSEASETFIRHAVASNAPTEATRELISDIMRPLPLLRREFHLPFEPVRARAYVAAVGFADLHINGSLASDRVFDPVYTHYTNRRLFSCIDVTGPLKKGRNALGISLGNGWAESFYHLQPERLDVIHYGRPEVRVLVLFEGANGEREWITTDDQWKMTDGPVRRSHLYVGEQFDARKLPAGWDEPGFDDSNWQTPPQGERFTGEFEPMLIAPERVVKTLKPVAVTEPSPGVFVFELPETTSGWPKLRVRGGTPGETVILRVSQSTWGDDWGNANPKKDLLHYDTVVNRRADGMLFIDNYLPIKSKAFNNGSLPATFAYTCAGNAEEVWTPRFVYMPVRYIEVIGYPGAPTLDDISFEVIHSDLPKIGEADPGNPVMRELQWKFLNTYLYCSHGTLQDNANHERGGWTGDAYQGYAMFAHYHDCGLFIDKFMADVRANFSSGLPPKVCPTTARGDAKMAMDWAVSTILIAWENFQRTGDFQALEKHFPAMEQTLATIQDMTGGEIENLRGFGDWLDAAPGKAQPRPNTPWDNYGIGVNRPLHTHPILSTGCWVMGAADATAKAARLLGKDPAQWQQMADSMKAQLRERFFKDGGFGSQTGNALALAHGLVESPEEIASTAAQFDRIVREEWGGHPNAGLHGVRENAQMLGIHGYPETANNMFLVEGYPGWRDATKGKRTTIGPGWGPSIARQVQQAHGAGGRWFFNGLAGINPSPEGPGYRHILLAPQFPSGHPSASATLMTAQGEIKSAWKRAGDRIVWNVTVPWNTTATVKFPDGRTQEIEAGKHEFTINAGDK